MLVSTLIIFIKNAQLGKVKTRLAATVGDEAALAIYNKLCLYTKSIAMRSESNNYVFYSNFIEEEGIWDSFNKRLQKGDDLGERMKNAFEEVSTSFTKTIIIGSDCATLSEEILNLAFQLLENQDVVIGPAEDGGYYLLGMKKVFPCLFENIEWSSDSVLTKTIEAVEKLQLKYALLPTLSDIDTEQDWQKVAHRF